MNKLVPSANKRIIKPVSVTMSFMHNKKSKGPRIDPLGTPMPISKNRQVTLNAVFCL